MAGHRRTLRIELDVDLDGEPIGGRLTAGAEEAKGFTGWVALAHEIELALDAAKARPVEDHMNTDRPGGGSTV